MADKLKLTEEELKSIQTALSNVNQAKTILGEATNQAFKAQIQVNSMEEAMIGVQKELEEKYGSITVDITTGEYEEVVAEAEEAAE